MDITQLLNIVYDLSLVMILVPPTVFVFGVTLLGTAIDKALQEEKLAKENDRAGVAKHLEELRGILNSFKKGGETDEIDKQIEVLKKSKNEMDKKLSQIRRKYQRINVSNTVVQPLLAFILSALSSRLLISLIGNNNLIYLLILVCAFFVYGALKVYLALSLIQEISSNKKENEYFDNISDAFKNALAEYYQGTKEEASLIFPDKNFPLNINTLTQFDLGFRVKLVKGKVLRNVKVWFFIPDGFELIDPPESESYRQDADYRIPNIRTVRIEIGSLNVGSYTSKVLKVKTPTNGGKYTISYKIYAEGYASQSRDITLFVE